jgi:hypothetical protein
MVLERTIMRFSTFLTFASLSCGLALAADPHVVTYISGNLDGLAPNSGATLDVSGEKALSLRASGTAIEVPFAGIAHAEAGEVTTIASEEPLYKVWALHKRFNKRELQQVKVDFKTPAGENRTMILELEKPAADSVLATIESRTSPEAKQTWWGDSIWKTKRNQDQWGGTGTVAARE